jgi:PQQ-dependent catabolism-associated CXXCW motif protein
MMNWAARIAMWSLALLGPLIAANACLAQGTTAASALENNYADELTDWGVPPQTSLKSDVGTRTPMELPGARRITTGEVQQLHAQAVLLDVLDSKHPATIPDAIYVPGAGNFGRFDDQLQRRLFRLLSDLTNRDMNRPIIFFCEGPKCWESYNAALRAVNLGFRNVLWYRGGLASWTEANLPLSSVPPARRLR